MSTARVDRNHRLDPFAFVADTDARFLLLMLAVIGASVMIYMMFFNNVPAFWDYSQQLQAQCREQATRAHPDNSFDASNARRELVKHCLAPLNRWEAMWVIAGLMLLFAAAFAAYRLYPRLKIKRARLQPLTADDAPEVVAELASLCQAAALASAPRFVWNPLNAASAGLAFGYRGNYYVALSGGLVMQYYTDPDAFRAVIRHELAHLRNGDVDITYFTVAIWQAFALLALLPLILLLMTKPPATVWGLGYRATALALLVYLARNAVLRVREVYADARAARWDGANGALARVVASLPSSHRLPRWRRWLSLHPDPQVRSCALQDSGALFRLNLLEVFATGMAASIALQNVEFLLSLLLPHSEVFYRAVGAALVFGSLAMFIVGSGIWRERLCQAVQHCTRAMIWKPALALTLGSWVGMRLSFVAYGHAQSQTALQGMAMVVFDLVWLSALFVGIAFTLRWVRDSADAWLGAIADRRMLRRVQGWGLGIAALLFAFWWGLLLYLLAWRVTGADTEILELAKAKLDFAGSTLLFSLIMLGVGAWGAVSHPVTLVLAALLWIFPFAAGRAQARDLSWALGGTAATAPDAPSVPALAPVPLAPMHALWIGLLAGAAFTVVLLSNVLGAMAVLSLPQVVLGIAAGIAAARVRALGWVHGLLAAFVAGAVVALAAAYYFPASFGAESLLIYIGGTVGGGLLLAVPVGLSVQAVAVRLRRRREPTSVPYPA